MKDLVATTAVGKQILRVPFTPSLGTALHIEGLLWRLFIVAFRQLFMNQSLGACLTVLIRSEFEPKVARPLKKGFFHKDS